MAEVIIRGIDLDQGVTGVTPEIGQEDIHRIQEKDQDTNLGKYLYNH